MRCPGVVTKNRAHLWKTNYSKPETEPSEPPYSQPSTTRAGRSVWTVSCSSSSGRNSQLGPVSILDQAHRVLLLLLLIGHTLQLMWPNTAEKQYYTGFMKFNHKFELRMSDESFQEWYFTKLGSIGQLPVLVARQSYGHSM